MRFRRKRFGNHLITSLMLVAILLLGLHHETLAADSTGSDASSKAMICATAASHAIEATNHLGEGAGHRYLTPRPAPCCGHACNPGFLASAKLLADSGLCAAAVGLDPAGMVEGMPPSCPMRPPKSLPIA